MGMEFRDSAYLLSAKNTRALKTNMIFNLALGFNDLDDEGGKKYVALCHMQAIARLILILRRYAIQLVDTVKIDHEKGICLTDCIKQSKDVLFFINSQSEDEAKAKSSKSAKPPVKPLNGHGSPAKNKVAGGKVLRNKTRNAAQEDVIVTVAARIAEHQKELHAARQREGLAKYSEEGQGAGNKEGKGWKKFQSYKGEAGLPREVENMRVSC